MLYVNKCINLKCLYSFLELHIIAVMVQFQTYQMMLFTSHLLTDLESSDMRSAVGPRLISGTRSSKRSGTALHSFGEHVDDVSVCSPVQVNNSQKSLAAS